MPFIIWPFLLGINLISNAVYFHFRYMILYLSSRLSLFLACTCLLAFSKYSSGFFKKLTMCYQWFHSINTPIQWPPWRCHAEITVGFFNRHWLVYVRIGLSIRGIVFSHTKNEIWNAIQQQWEVTLSTHINFREEEPYTWNWNCRKLPAQNEKIQYKLGISRRRRCLDSASTVCSHLRSSYSMSFRADTSWRQISVEE